LGPLDPDSIDEWVEKATTLANGEPIDLLTGGFPCQPFSGFGKGLGFNDERFIPAKLLHEAVSRLKPRYVLLENVKKITSSRFKKGFEAYLNLFRSSGYSISVHVGNPIALGYIQSRGRVYIAMTREGEKKWEIPADDKGWKKGKKQIFVEDSVEDTSQFYKIPAKRCERLFDDSREYFDCLCARTIDAHDKRFSWIPYQGDGRSPTSNEIFQLFGYEEYPTLKLVPRKGISRSNFGYSMGNSWHVGHAATLLKTLPLGDK
jgi:site-specific DNA-cytosine methylase